MNKLGRRIRKSFNSRMRTLLHPWVSRHNSRLLDRLVPAPVGDEAENWLLIASASNFPTRMGTILLAARYLSQAGWSCRMLYQHRLTEALGNCDGLIGGALEYRPGTYEIHLAREVENDPPVDLEIDLAAGTIMHRGVNYYPAIEYSVSNHARLYEVDLTAPEYETATREFIVSLRSVLTLCLRIEKLAESKRVAILSEQILGVPNGVLKTFFFNSPARDKVDLYCVNDQFYMFNDNEKLFCSRVVFSRICESYFDSAFYVTRDAFARWKAGLSEAKKKEILDFALAKMGGYNPLSKLDRQRHGEDEVIARYKAAGKPVYCLFGNLTFEKSTEENDIYFLGMLDWIAKTVEAFRHIDGLLVIKPHVAEALYKHKIPKQNLTAFCRTLDLPDNVVVLDPQGYTAVEISRMVDAAILWRSTALLDMRLLGVPNLLCVEHGYFSDALEVEPPPRSFDEYVQRLKAVVGVKPTPQQMADAAAFLYYSAQVRAIPLDFMSDFLGDDYSMLVLKPLAVRRLLERGMSERETVFGRTIAERLPEAIAP